MVRRSRAGKGFFELRGEEESLLEKYQLSIKGCVGYEHSGESRQPDGELLGDKRTTLRE